MFWKSKKIDMEMIRALKPTSKATAKLQCLMTCGGDVDKAEKLYDFLVKDMDNLPDFEPVAPSTMSQVKETAGSIFGWVKENKDDILSAVDFIRNFKNPVAPTSGTPLPPLNP